LNNLAYALATAEEGLRDPAEALRWARRAVEISPVEDPRFLGTLAIALAATGQADEAAAKARRALELARKRGMSELAKQIEEDLRRYEQGRTNVSPRVGQPSTK
jgi:tetratricopeptide (TPR) repeat protein